MAPINNKPFMDYLLEYLITNRVKKVIFSVHYKYELLINQYGYNYKGIKIIYSIDKEALGTGGAIKAALQKTENNNVFIINGDTYFNVNLFNLLEVHTNAKNDITISLKPMKNFDRYGFVKIDNTGEIVSFNEKKYCKDGNIDGGVYLINKNIYTAFEIRKKFSFNDFIIKNLKNIKAGSILCDELFIDIGTPEDYEKALKVLPNLS